MFLMILFFISKAIPFSYKILEKYRPTRKEMGLIHNPTIQKYPLLTLWYMLFPFNRSVMQIDCLHFLMISFCIYCLVTCF